jgi:putative membrane protein
MSDFISDKKRHAELLLVFFAALLWSVIHPHDYFTWILEVFPALFGAVVLFTTYRKFAFTTFAYSFICIHAIILMIGGHYTYAEVPLFNWLRDTYHLDRNYYDRVGHFAQGFVPAIIAREIFVRNSVVAKKGWLFFIVVCICLAISAFYELIEWRVSVATGTAADAFLGSQGDAWDTQWDMATALIGVLTSLVMMSSFHDRAMEKLSRRR